MELAPRLALWSGLFLTVTVYCLTVGDAVRDLLDPRLRGQIGRSAAPDTVSAAAG